MKIITPSVELMRTGLETEVISPEQFIEKVGRTCYKSEDKITDDSAAKFVSNLIKRGHEAMIEHWNLIFKVDAAVYESLMADYNALLHHGRIVTDEPLRPYIRFTDWQTDALETRCVISGNMRAWRDFVKACVEGYGLVPQYLYGLIRNYPLFFPEYQDYVPAIINNDILTPISVTDLVGDKEIGTHWTVTAKFICDRGVSHEMVRHRVASFAQESTRYCNYSQDKFGQEITVVRPAWCGDDIDVFTIWKNSVERAESNYFDILLAGAKPQEARSVLPNSLKTEIIVTMTLNDWDHFFGLRCAPEAHPDMREVACMCRYLFHTEIGDAVPKFKRNIVHKSISEEDTCRATIVSYESDKLTWEQYKDSESSEQRGWADAAKMRANKAAITYNEYFLKNGYVFDGNIPADIRTELAIIE